MPHDRFIVVEINQSEGYGFVRQIDPQKAPKLDQPIRFDATRAAQITYEFVDGSIQPTGFQVARDHAISARHPHVGTELLGNVAFETGPWRVAIGADGNPFLRNWGYADQPPEPLSLQDRVIAQQTDQAYRELYADENLIGAIDALAADLGIDLDDQPDDVFDEPYGPDDFIEEWPEEDEDPLAGDVEPTGGYYVPPMHPFEAQRLEVMRQHGDYTG